MQDKILYILNWFKEQKVSVAKLEQALGFSNGLLGKAAKGTTTLSEDKWCKLDTYYKTKLREGLEGALSVQTAVNTLLSTGAVQPALENMKRPQWVADLEAWCEEKCFQPEEIIEKYEELAQTCKDQSSTLYNYSQNKPFDAPEMAKSTQDEPDFQKSRQKAKNAGESKPKELSPFLKSLQATKNGQK